jgi:hypothetical protein
MRDLHSSREIAQWEGQYEIRSPDGRFDLTTYYVHDHGSPDGELKYAFGDDSDLRFYDFTRRGAVVAARRHKSDAGDTAWNWLADVPFWGHLNRWATRNVVFLLDPETGNELARTQPLWSEPGTIAFSHDGSRMAVFNYEGVYIYDVPAEFR